MRKLIVAAALAVGVAIAAPSVVFAGGHTGGGGGAEEKIEGKVSAVKREGRVVVINSTEVKISGSRTKVKVKGAEADRSEIKAGMTCSALHKGGRASQISCK
jgi:ribosomal protein L36